MSTQLINEDTCTRQLDTQKTDAYDNVLPAIHNFICNLNFRCEHVRDTDIWRVRNDHERWVTMCSGIGLRIKYEIQWLNSVSTIDPHHIPMFIRHFLYKTTKLLESFTIDFELPEFINDRRGATGFLTITRK